MVALAFSPFFYHSRKKRKTVRNTTIVCKSLIYGFESYTSMHYVSQKDYAHSDIEFELQLIWLIHKTSENLVDY